MSYGYGGPPMGGGYDMGYGAPPPMGGGYGAPPMGGGYEMGVPPMNMGGPPMGGGYGGPPMDGGYGAPPMGGGYGAPPMGGYNNGPPPMGYNNGPPMGYNNGPPMGGPPMGSPMGYNNGPPMGGPPMGGGYGGPPMGGGYGAPPQDFRASQGGVQQGGSKKALLIGINYLRHERGRLKGCINDVKNMEELLRSYGFQPQNMRILTDDLQDQSRQPTKANILRDIRWLVEGAKPGDSLFFHFSGHGSQVKDLNGDEDDGMDETILPVDYNTAGQIIDDTLHEMMVAPLPAGCKLTSLMDCCHSGTGLDLPYVHNLPSANGRPQKQIKPKKKKMMKLLGMAANMGGIQIPQGIPGLSGIGAGYGPSGGADPPGTSKADVYLYSGCRDDQTSADTSVNGSATGAMTWAFTSALKRNRNLTYWGILESMREVLNGSGNYTQVPQLSTGRRSDLQQIFVI